MSENKARKREREHDNDVRLSPLEKDGEKLLAVLEKGSMAAILSNTEIMYVVSQGDYRCYIHALDAEEGRAKRFPKTAKYRAVIKNLADLADLLFEVEYKKGMDVMGVMVAAEKGIVAFLDVTGQLPAEDVDFMQWKETPEEHGE